MRSKNTNEQIKQKLTRRNREQTGGWQMAGGLGKLVKQMKGLKGTTWQLQNSHGDVKHNTEDIINNTVITVLVSDG